MLWSELSLHLTCLWRFVPSRNNLQQLAAVAATVAANTRAKHNKWMHPWVLSVRLYVCVCVCVRIHAKVNWVAKNFAAPSVATCHCKLNLNKALYHAGSSLATAGDSKDEKKKSNWWLIILKGKGHGGRRREGVNGWKLPVAASMS